MPLTSSTPLLETSKSLVSALHQAAGGVHSGFRPAHARGVLLTGTFTPTREGATLSIAPHFHGPSTPVTVRFSSSTGLPEIPDTDANANPRGFALRFHLGGRRHTDIVAHSTPSFPTRTGGEFLEFLHAALSGQPDAVPEFLSRHPETKRFLEVAQAVIPGSFATVQYFGVNAFKFVSGAGNQRFLRYRIVPVAGIHTLSPEEREKKEGSYLFDELKNRLEGGPIEFKLVAQMAEEGDEVNDATVLWPEDRRLVELGTVKLDNEVEALESAKEQKYIIFDPIPRVEGIEPSDDPLLEVRPNVYLVSGRERRAA